eukprot:579169-Amphidinium_carterae.1
MGAQHHGYSYMKPGGSVVTTHDAAAQHYWNVKLQYKILWKMSERKVPTSRAITMNIPMFFACVPVWMVRAWL